MKNSCHFNAGSDALGDALGGGLLEPNGQLGSCTFHRGTPAQHSEGSPELWSIYRIQHKLTFLHASEAGMYCNSKLLSFNPGHGKGDSSALLSCRQECTWACKIYATVEWAHMMGNPVCSFTS